MKRYDKCIFILPAGTSHQLRLRQCLGPDLPDPSTPRGQRHRPPPAPPQALLAALPSISVAPPPSSSRPGARPANHVVQDHAQLYHALKMLYHAFSILLLQTFHLLN